MNLVCRKYKRHFSVFVSVR